MLGSVKRAIVSSPVLKAVKSKFEEYMNSEDDEEETPEEFKRNQKRREEHAKTLNKQMIDFLVYTLHYMGFHSEGTITFSIWLTQTTGQYIKSATAAYILLGSIMIGVTSILYIMPLWVIATFALVMSYHTYGSTRIAYMIAFGFFALFWIYRRIKPRRREDDENNNTNIVLCITMASFIIFGVVMAVLHFYGMTGIFAAMASLLLVVSVMLVPHAVVSKSSDRTVMVSFIAGLIASAAFILFLTSIDAATVKDLLSGTTWKYAHVEKYKVAMVKKAIEEHALLEELAAHQVPNIPAHIFGSREVLLEYATTIPGPAAPQPTSTRYAMSIPKLSFAWVDIDPGPALYRYAQMAAAVAMIAIMVFRWTWTLHDRTRGPQFHKARGMERVVKELSAKNFEDEDDGIYLQNIFEMPIWCLAEIVELFIFWSWSTVEDLSSATIGLLMASIFLFATYVWKLLYAVRWEEIGKNNHMATKNVTGAYLTSPVDYKNGSMIRSKYTMLAFCTIICRALMIASRPTSITDWLGLISCLVSLLYYLKGDDMRSMETASALQTVGMGGHFSVALHYALKRYNPTWTMANFDMRHIVNTQLFVQE